MEPTYEEKKNKKKKKRNDVTYALKKKSHKRTQITFKRCFKNYYLFNLSKKKKKIEGEHKYRIALMVM